VSKQTTSTCPLSDPIGEGINPEPAVGVWGKERKKGKKEGERRRKGERRIKRRK